MSLSCVVLCVCQVRRAAASKLFEAVLMFDGLAADGNLDELNSLLSETQW